MKKWILLLLLAAVVAAGVVAQNKAGQVAESKLRSITQRLQDKVAVDFDDVDVRLLGLDVVVHNLSITTPKGQRASARSVTVDNADLRHPRRPRFVAVHIDDLEIPVIEENFSSQVETLGEMGLETLRADVSLDYEYDPDEQVLTLRRLTVEAPDIGNAAVRLSARNVDVQKLKALDLADLRIESVAVTYEDGSMLARMVQSAADDEPEFMEFLGAGLQEDIQTARDSGNLYAATQLEEVYQFIKKPDEISVRAELGAPITVQQFLKLKKITELLGLFRFNIQAG